jgi:intracellular septation protein
MKLAFELFILVTFFVLFKLSGLYAAIASAIVLYGVQLLITWIVSRKVEKLQLVTFLMVAILGGATFLFQDEMFFKWKPTVIYLLFGLAIIVTQMLTRSPASAKLLGKAVSMPNAVAYKLDYAWVLFFVTVAGLNILVAYSFNTEIWVYFKLFGILGLLLLFLVLQGFWLAPHLKEKQHD